MVTTKFSRNGSRVQPTPKICKKPPTTGVFPTGPFYPTTAFIWSLGHDVYGKSLYSVGNRLVTGQYPGWAWTADYETATHRFHFLLTWTAPATVCKMLLSAVTKSPWALTQCWCDWQPIISTNPFDTGTLELLLPDPAIFKANIRATG